MSEARPLTAEDEAYMRAACSEGYAARFYNIGWIAGLLATLDAALALYDTPAEMPSDCHPQEG